MFLDDFYFFGFKSGQWKQIFSELSYWKYIVSSLWINHVRGISEYSALSDILWTLLWHRNWNACSGGYKNIFLEILKFLVGCWFRG